MPQSASQVFTGNVVAAAALAFTTAAALPDATEFAAYSEQLAVSGGTAPFHFVVSAGALPAGLALSDSGLISGTPTASGAFSVTITVTDSGA